MMRSDKYRFGFYKEVKEVEAEKSWGKKYGFGCHHGIINIKAEKRWRLHSK